jgi:hypothetical protein
MERRRGQHVDLRGTDVDARCAGGLETGLRWAMMIGVCIYLWAGLHFLVSARTLRRDWEA